MRLWIKAETGQHIGIQIYSLHLIPHRRIMLCLCGLPGGEGAALNGKAAKGGVAGEVRQYIYPQRSYRLSVVLEEPK